MTKSRVANLMLQDVPWDGNELASPLTLPGALIAPSYVEQQVQTTPATPAAGKVRLYPKPDGKYYTLNAGGVETELGSGGGSSYVHPDPFTIGTITVTTKATLKSPDITGDMSFVPDSTHDIGVGAKRPRDLIVARNQTVGGDATIVGSLITNTVKAPTGVLVFQTQDASPINFKPNGADSWSIAADGNFRPTSTNGTLDLGAPANRARNLYLYNVIDQRQINTPAPPPAGSLRIYPKTNGKLYTLNSAGLETDLTAVGHVVADPLTLNEGLTVNGWMQAEILEMQHDPESGTRGARIIADLSASPNSDRLMFETNVANEGSFLGVKPNGSGIGSAITVYNQDDTPSSAYGTLWIDGTQVVVGAGASGAGVALPLSIWSGGAERIRVETGGGTTITGGDLSVNRGGNEGRLYLGTVNSYLRYATDSWYLSAGWLNIIAGGMNVSEHVQMANRKEFRWVDANSKIMSYDRTMYFDDSAGWAWRTTPANTAVMFLNSTGGLKFSSYIEQTLISTPGNPPAGTIRAYPKTDGRYYTLSSAGVEKPLGGSPFTENLLFSPDNTYDIGASGATRPQDLYLGRNLNLPAPGVINVGGVERVRIVAAGAADAPGRTSISGPVDVALNANAYLIPPNWVRYDTVNSLGHLVVSQGTLTFYNAIAGTGSPAWINRFGVAADGKVMIGTAGQFLWPRGAGTLSIEAPAQHIMLASKVTTHLCGNTYWDGVNWLSYDAAVGSSLIGVAQGGITFYNAAAGTPGTLNVRASMATSGQWTFNNGINTNAITTADWFRITNSGQGVYNQTHNQGIGIDGSGLYNYNGGQRIHHDGNYPVSESHSGSTLVKRTANGYIYCNYINTSADDQGGASPYRVAGQNGDGFLRWYTKSAVGRPPAWGAQENYFSIGGASTPSGTWTNAGNVSPTSNPCGCTYSGNSIWVNKSGYWVIRYRAGVNGGSWGWGGGLRILINGGGWTQQTGTFYNGASFDMCEVCLVGAGTYFTFQGYSHGSGAYGTGSIAAGSVHLWFIPTDQYPY